jgi:arylsulfatase A-like enzyme
MRNRSILIIILLFFVCHNPVLAVSGDVMLNPDDLSCPDCNIVLLTVDALRADHLGCYGYQKPTTPNIDALAQEGILFRNAYSSAPVTVPALTTMMNGVLISNEVKAQSVRRTIKNTHPFLAEILGTEGYRTAGFTDYFALTKKPFWDSFEYAKNIGENYNQATSHLLANEVIKWLEENSQQKFFLWAHFSDPHNNYNPLPEYERIFGYSSEHCGRIKNGMDIVKIRKISKSLKPSEVDCLVSLYDSEIYFTDQHIGRVLRKLKELKIDQKTIIIFTADHGEELSERTHWVGHEKTLYNEMIRVPLIIKNPGHKSAVVENTWGTRELFKLLSNLGSPQNTYFDDGVVSRTYHFWFGDKEQEDFALIKGGYKLIYNPMTWKEKLYRLENDAGETKNLVRDSKVKDIRKSMKGELFDWIKRNKINNLPELPEPLYDDQELEQLRSLGYLQ